MENRTHTWHRRVVGQQVERVLGDVYRLPILANFYLAGGTGLALHFGHRRSEDLDFFSPEPVDADALIQEMQTLSDFSVVAKAAETLHATVQGVKLSFLGYAYPVLFPFESFLGIPVADARDIACMKLAAIAGRGTKRDFVDLYVVSKRYGLRQLLEWFKQKYARANYSTVHLLKSLTYFEEAEQEPMPHMLEALSWSDVKAFFTSEAPRLT